MTNYLKVTASSIILVIRTTQNKTGLCLTREMYNSRFSFRSLDSNVIVQLFKLITLSARHVTHPQIVTFPALIDSKLVPNSFTDID